jgi:hypothetical protein
MDPNFLPANLSSVVEILDALALSVTAVFPPSLNPVVSFSVSDNPVENLLAGKYEFRVRLRYGPKEEDK